MTATRGLVHADIRTRIEGLLVAHPDHDVIEFTVERGELSTEDVKLIDQAIYESAREIDGVAFATVVVDGNNAQLVSIRIHREL